MKIHISIASQSLTVHDDSGAVVMRAPVSTAKNGAGEVNGSLCTPRGRHRVRMRIGGGCPPGTVFRARRPTGETFTAGLRRRHPGRDWILARILWLSGDEPGRNRGGDVDTMARYIYIHGAPDDVPGKPLSHGCIGMSCRDVIQLFDLVEVGCPVFIAEGGEGGE
ncbi:MAG: L,D-transpeptidase [Gammaproteobacteria bacterium]|nr:L,D-transpeptidase [Gammaproteobacteria bacterium]MDD9800313.1 L,D-transpeptidase [Gammaproteobacteria bacterium]MDD9870976.1 L,D-transpeptidase [Gammaproteobacteria bacterium]